MLYTDEMKKELEETIRSIDDVPNIMWRWDPWVGSDYMRFVVGEKAFRLFFSQEGFPISYDCLNGFWDIDAERGRYLPSTVKYIITTLCNLLDIYDTKEIKDDIRTLASQNKYEFPDLDDEPGADRRALRIAGAYIREHRIECDREGILLQVFVVLCAKTFIYDYDEAERIKKEKRKLNKNETAKLPKRSKKKKRNKKKVIRRYVY